MESSNSNSAEQDSTNARKSETIENADSLNGLPLFWIASWKTLSINSMSKMFLRIKENLNERKYWINWNEWPTSGLIMSNYIGNAEKLGNFTKIIRIKMAKGIWIKTDENN